LAASACTDEVSALNNVDLPTFGNPTMPQAIPMVDTRKMKNKERAKIRLL